MKALIFAAGRGVRMRPLTEHTPKPLLQAGGKPLIVWQLERLADAGVRHVLINTAHLGPQFPPALGDGSRWGMRIDYLHEGDEPLETGGGMLAALPLLEREPFLVVNGDVWCDADFATLPREPVGLAHLLLVDNPPHHAQGDFVIDHQGGLRRSGEERLTYAGIGVFRRELLDDWKRVIGPLPAKDANPPRFKLAPLLFDAIDRGLVSGQRHSGGWVDVGTPQRLADLDAMLGARAGRAAK